MKEQPRPNLPRRSFLKQVSLLSGAAALGPRRGVAGAPAEMPLRVLGRTGLRVSALTLGTWPCGMCKELGAAGAERLVREGLDLGINFIDTARAYGHGETAVARAIQGRRDGLVLATKTWANTAEEARESLERSLRELRTDHVDIAYLHSVGDRDVTVADGDAGALDYLLRQKDEGKVRFVGISGHSRPAEFVPMIESGKIDVALLAMNFADRHTYGFEDKVLPVARKHRLGVCCMKVFGGMRGGFAAASGPNTGPEVEADYLQRAVRYALELPGVSTLVIGPHTVEHLRQDAAWVRDYTPLSEAERRELDRVGRAWAKAWGPHFGPVA